MKKLYSLIAFVALGTVGFSQIEIHWDQEPGVDQGGDTVYWSDGGSLIYPHLYVIDVSGSGQDLLWGRKIIDTQQGYSDQLCDDILCYIPTGSDWTLAASSAFTLGANDSTDFLPKLDNGGVAGTAHYRYYVKDDQGAKMDSVDVIFTATVGVDEIVPVSMNTYPNPASDVFNVQIGDTKGYQVSMDLFNVVGKRVMNTSLQEGLNTIDLSTLGNGVYFYSLIQNGEVIETKKLIIRK